MSLTASQAIFCKQFEGLFFTESVLSIGTTVKTKTESKPLAVDCQIATLIKRGIEFKVVEGRIFDKELVYVIDGVTVRNLFNIA